jgi:hypothetical protein
VFGFDIIPGSTTAPWILEGLAEYARGAWDPGDLVALRDAIRANRIPAIERLDGDATGFGEATGIGQRLTWGLGHAAFDFIESRWGKAGVRQFLFGLRRAALEGGDPYELGLRMPRHEFGRAFEQYLKERFTGSPLQLRDDRFDSSDTLRIEGEITTIATPASAGLACLQLSAVEDGSRRKWAVECGEGAGDKLLPALKPGDRVIVTGPPARKPATERLLMRSLVRPADGFTWPARPQ